MAEKLTIREDDGQLTFKLHVPGRWWTALAPLSGGILLSYACIHNVKPDIVAFGLVGWLGSAYVPDIVASWRGTAVTLVVRSVDMRSAGYSGRGYGACAVMRSSVTRLEHRSSSGGGKAARPAGLYAVVGEGLGAPAACLLPELNTADTTRCVLAILRCFPDTSDGVAPNNPYPSQMITLWPKS